MASRLVISPISSSSTPTPAPTQLPSCRISLPATRPAGRCSSAACLRCFRRCRPSAQGCLRLKQLTCLPYPCLLSGKPGQQGQEAMSKKAIVKSVETLSCDAGWRNYHFVKVVTEDGIVGWSEFDEGFGAPGVGVAIERLSARVIGKNAFAHERIYAELFSATRPAAGGVVALALGAIENALLDVKAKALGVPCYELLGGKIRDRVRVYWSHCATWRINHPDWYKPAITGLDGVKAIGREVREQRFTALKTNIFT